MDVVLLLVLAASGLSAVSSQVRRQYHFVYDRKNMTEAQKYCREKYTDLATIDNMEDMKILNDTVDTSKAFDLFWIGLYDDVNSWRWSLSDTSFYRDGETEFRLWQDGEPDNRNSREHCTAMIDDGRWHDVDRKYAFRSVCMDVRGLNVTFVLIEEKMTWTEAQSYCREHHTDLASVRNMTENQKVKDLVPAGQKVWIGLFRDSWKWSDGSDSSFKDWAPGEPEGGNQACVVVYLRSDGTWRDNPCDQNRPFVCYGPPAVQTTSSSSTTSSTTQPDTGLSVVSSQVRRQYHFVYDQKNRTEAQKYCREKYTDLATIDNMEDMKMLNNTVDTSKASNRVWIGLYDDVNSWRWSLSDTSFYRDGETEFRLWASGQPSNFNSREYCTQMYSDGRWNDDDCKYAFRSVCMDVRGLNVTFVLITTPKTWTEAQSYCREHHTDLASVRNTAENQKVKDLVPAGQKAWIGLFRDSWKWSDGSNSSFRYWAEDQPNNYGGNQDCVVAGLGIDGKWWDDPCGQTRPILCYSLPAVQTTSSSSSTSSTTQPDAAAVQTTSSSSTTSSTTQPDAVTMTTKQVIKVRLETKDSSLDLNDPAVMEQMLKEVQQRLKDQGVKGDVKLSWRKQADGKVFHEEEEETKKKKETCPNRDEI